MREAFEEWMSQDGKWPRAIERVAGKNAYAFQTTAAAWEAWQAAWLECQVANAKESRESARSAAVEVSWKERQGEDYGSY
jgi:hypothetical protein